MSTDISLKEFFKALSDNNEFPDIILNENTEITKLLKAVKSNIENKYINRQELESVTENYISVILEYALHNYSHQIEIKGEDDLLNSLATSINLLGEELNHSTITRHYLEDIFSSMPDMMIVVDEFGYIDSVNKTTICTLKYRSENILRKNISLILEEGLNIKSFISKAKSGENIYFITKENEYVPVSITISPFLRGDNLKIGSVIIARDISLIRKYQQEIEEQNTKIKASNEELKIALKKAEESDELKTAFLQNMSHEIRTPLNVILGLTQLMNNFDISVEERQEYAGIIEKSSNRLIEIVNNVLDISKIETGQIKINDSTFSVNTLVRDIYYSFQPEAEEKNLKLKYKIPFNKENDLLISDSGKITQVLSNLVKNALKFTDSGEVEFGYSIKGDMLEFFSHDTGIGIDPSLESKVFERFIQADNSLTRKYEGAGLGLSISKGLVELMGGTIWFTSQPNVGTSFFFTIPFSQPVINTENEKKEEMDYTLNSRVLNILIAEDDDLNFLYFERLMRTLKHTIIRARNGAEAIELCNSVAKLDIVLMDIKMPGMDGIEATKILKSMRPDLPVIALTAFAFNEEKSNILQAGFDDYISKPIKIDVLFSSIKTCLKL